MHFARHGIPDTCFTDKGPCFVSDEFKAFSKLWGFMHQMCSPRHHQSNGKAENAVKTMKRLILKAKKANEDPYLAILEFRNTPSQFLNVSPLPSVFLIERPKLG